MIEAIPAATPTAPASPIPAAATSPPKGDPASTGATSTSEPPATRVYVDRSASGVYVYRLVDVSTGRVLAELPRAAGGTLDVSADYSPGTMASQTV